MGSASYHAVRVLRARAAQRYRAAWLCWALLLTGAGVGKARANFIGPYAPANFTLANSVFANGFWSSDDPGTLVLTGPNDGSAQPGSTTFTIAAASAGSVQFDYVYSSLDFPPFDDAGYLLSGTFYQLADTNGDFGTVLFTVSAGETFGFYAETLDNLGEPGILTISDFSAPASGAPAPAPEPGSLQLGLLGAAVCIGVARWRRRREASPMRLRAWLTRSAIMCLALPLMAQQSTYFGTNVTGQLALSGVVNLHQQAQALTGSMAAARDESPEALARFPILHLPVLRTAGPEFPPRIESARLRPSMYNNFLAPLAAASPASQSLTVSTSTTSTGFNALSHLDERSANNGNQFSIEPPNASIAVANGYVLEGVNDAIQVYNVSGSPSLPIVLSSNQFFGLAPAINRTTMINGVYLTDMRVYYDQTISRWMVVQRSQDEDIFGNLLTTSHLYVAVSQTADPTGSYNIYVMETTNRNHTRCPCVADYPQIGSDQYGFHIAWNEFSTISRFYVDASVLSISKASLSNGANTPTAVQFLIPYISQYESSLQPATTPPGAVNFLGNGGLEYFVSTGTGIVDSGLALWAMYNTSSLAGASPNLTMALIILPTSISYSNGGAVTQRPGPLPYGSTLSPPGSLAFLDGSDPRVLSLSYASGRLFLTFQTSVVDGNGQKVAGGAYAVLSPTFRSNVLAATVLNQGYLFVNGNNLLRPAIAVNALGTGSIAVTLVGPDWYPTAAFIPISSFSTPSTVQIAGLGTLPEDGFTGYPGGLVAGVARWGDYNGAFATSDGAIWMVAEYIGVTPGVHSPTGIPMWPVSSPDRVSRPLAFTPGWSRGVVEPIQRSQSQMRRKKPKPPKARKAKTPRTVASEGIVVADSQLRPISIDAGAEGILNDLAGQPSGVDGPAILPPRILDMLGTQPFEDRGVVDMHLRVGNREYTCRRFVTKPLDGSMQEPQVVLYLKREVSVIETVHQVGKDYHLTDREREALIGVSMGLTSKELAERMNVSPNTVKAFLRLIMLKMGATTRAGIVGKLLGQDGYIMKHAHGLDEGE